MKNKLRAMIESAWRAAAEKGQLPPEMPSNWKIYSPKNLHAVDFATNIALVSARNNNREDIDNA